MCMWQLCKFCPNHMRHFSGILQNKFPLNSLDLKMSPKIRCLEHWGRKEDESSMGPALGPKMEGSAWLRVCKMPGPCLDYIFGTLHLWNSLQSMLGLRIFIYSIYLPHLVCPESRIFCPIQVCPLPIPARPIKFAQCRRLGIRLVRLG